MWLESKAIDEGFDAYCVGVARAACPYPPWVKEYYDWLLGWDEAEEADFNEQRNG